MANNNFVKRDQDNRHPKQISRRSFLQSSSAAAAAGLSASVCFSPRALAGDSTNKDVLVHIFLRGGMDGLTTCVPYGDPELYLARPTLAIAPPGSTDGALDLDGFFGFAPALTGLMTPYSNGHLAVLHAAGSTDPTRSHFNAMIAMERGVPEQEYHTFEKGWLARHLNLTGAGGSATLQGLAITDTMPTHLVGAPGALPVANPSTLAFPGRPGTAALREQIIRNMYEDAPAPMDSAMEASFATLALFDSVGFDGYVPSGGAVYPEGPLGNQLRQSAALIKANVGVESISIDFGGWDLHNELGPIDGAMAGLLNTLGLAVEAFYLDLGSYINSVTLVAMSEFGRRVVQNGSLGTDHGHGNVMFVMGGHVNGGQVFSSWPGLAPANLDQGDLAVTTDYRNVVWEIMNRRLGATDVDAIFPNHIPTPVGVIQ